MSGSGLYEKYHTSRQDQRLELFALLRTELGVRSGLYPGCFVHVTPSFVIPEMHYVDSDRNARRFFASGEPEALVDRNKTYAEEATTRFYSQSYQDPLPIAEGSVDLLISQYAGFVSDACLRYLSPGGYLVANNSHGDAGVAACRPELELSAVLTRRGEHFTLRTTSLDAYFVPKSSKVPSEPTELAEHIRSLGRGLAYTKSAADYVFRKR